MNAKTQSESQQQEKHNTASLKLLMYRTMPACTSSWLAGFEAARSDLDLDDNPFSKDKDSYEFRSWQEGWWEGFYEEDYTAKELSDEILEILNKDEKYNGQIIGENSNHNSNFNPMFNNSNSTAKITVPSSKSNNFSIKNIIILLGIIFATFVGLNALLIE